MKPYFYLGEKLVTVLVSMMLATVGAADSSSRVARPNVLFIVVDDLNCDLPCMGGPDGVLTPNLDRLAKESVSFVNAQCPSPSCHPSRVAFLTGVSPLKTGITMNLKDAPSRPSWRLSPVLTNAITIPEYFKSLGYSVKGGGKIFHATQYESYNENDPAIWDDYFPSKLQEIPYQPVPPFDFFAKNKASGRVQGYLDWTPLKIPDSQMSDYKVVSWALDEINRKHTRPFFLAVGLIRPHVPFQVPEKYYEHYPLNTLKSRADYPPGTVPAPPVTSFDVIGGWGRRSYLWAKETHNIGNAMRGYYAGVTFCDTMIGRLLNGLREGPYASSTIVVFLSDNGYQLTDRERFEKFTLWKESTRVPLLISAPSLSKAGSVCRQPVSLLDIYPTLVELSGGKKSGQLDGESLVPWLKHPDAAKSSPVVIVGPEPGSLAMVTDRFRYISYFNGMEELYDLHSDPGEFNDLSTSNAYKSVIAHFRESIPHQVPEFIPPGATPAESLSAGTTKK